MLVPLSTASDPDFRRSNSASRISCSFVVNSALEIRPRETVSTTSTQRDNTASRSAFRASSSPLPFELFHVSLLQVRS